MLKIAIEMWYTNQFSWFDEYWARLFMQDFFSKYSIELVRVSINKFNQKKQYFTEYNIFDNTWKNFIIRKKYIPDIIRSRKWMAVHHKHDTFKNFILVPSQKISIIWNEKFENYKYAEKYQPFTTLLSSFFWSKNIQKTFNNKIVLKPIRANGWKWIVLTTVPELLKKRKKYNGLEELYIVQQFKDFSKWYPWICTCNHDIRLMFAGKNIIEITLRTPKKWDFRSNIWSWGTQKNLQKGQIPKDLLALSIQIYKDLNLDNTDIFSMDFAYCKKDKQRYLLEINSCPGTRYYQEDKNILKSIYLWLVNFFLSLKSS